MRFLPKAITAICLLVALVTQIEAKYSEFRIVPVKKTPESDTVILRIIFPKEYENKRKQPFKSQVRVEGFPLGVKSEFDRKNELYNDPHGQTVRVVIDNRPYLAFDQSFEDSFDENRIFFDKIVAFDLPYKLSAGQHVMRTYPARSFGESLKGTGCFDTRIFYVNDKSRTSDYDFQIDAPYLTYNEPQGKFPDSQEPILLDFYISNCELSKDGYKVRLSINGEVKRLLTEWKPYYLYGLKPGTHKVRLELLDKSNKVVEGAFNDTKREITIET